MKWKKGKKNKSMNDRTNCCLQWLNSAGMGTGRKATMSPAVGFAPPQSGFPI